jgi:hypothetical protein
VQSRDLSWAGCLNVRDLGGLPLEGGGVTTFGSVIRADNPAYLTESGWGSLERYGVRTIVALRTKGSVDDEPDGGKVPQGIALRRVVVEDGEDAEFIRRCVDTMLFGTPIYFREMLLDWPELCAAGVAAVADAEPGGVVVSCGRGCDRTGLVSFLLLALAGVTPEAIAQDWWLSVDRLRPRDPSYEQVLREVLDREATNVGATIAEILRTTDVVERLLEGGLSAEQLHTARRRLLDA